MSGIPQAEDRVQRKLSVIRQALRKIGVSDDHTDDSAKVLVAFGATCAEDILELDSEALIDLKQNYNLLPMVAQKIKRYLDSTERTGNSVTGGMSDRVQENKMNPGDSASQEDLPVVLRERFFAERCIGVGGSGTVIRATTVLRGGKQGSSKCAIKIVLPARGQRFTKTERARLDREVIILDRIRHPNLVSGVGEVGGPLESPESFYVIMELLEGRTLLNMLETAPAGRLRAKDAVRACMDVLEGLTQLHCNGIVHRDIKPCNVVEHQNRFKIIDLGIAVGLDGCASETLLSVAATHSHASVQGTPAYMSPEALGANHQGSKEPLTSAVDIWAVGVMLFQLVAGRLPFKGHTVEIMYLVLKMKEPPQLMEVLAAEARGAEDFSEELSKIAAKAMQRSPADRFESSHAMRHALLVYQMGRRLVKPTVFISYRVATDQVMAVLLFFLLNNEKTSSGVTISVYLDKWGIKAGDDWADNFSQALCSSKVFLPLLTYGSTAPMAGCDVAIDAEQRPAGRARLQGGDGDAVDNVLKEQQLALALMEGDANGERFKDTALEGFLPLLVGNLRPDGRRDDPFDSACFGGGGSFAESVSPATTQAVVEFLEGRGLGATSKVKTRTVKATIEALKRIQGIRLPEDPADATLSPEEMEALDQPEGQALAQAEGIKGALLRVKPELLAALDRILTKGWRKNPIQKELRQPAPPPEALQPQAQEAEQKRKEEARKKAEEEARKRAEEEAKKKAEEATLPPSPSPSPFSHSWKPETRSTKGNNYLEVWRA